MTQLAILDAPSLSFDFYSHALAWSPLGLLAVALGADLWVCEGRECARKPALRVCAERASRFVPANMRQRSALDSMRLTICA